MFKTCLKRVFEKISKQAFFLSLLMSANAGSKKKAKVEVQTNSDTAPRHKLKVPDIARSSNETLINGTWLTKLPGRQQPAPPATA